MIFISHKLHEVLEIADRIRLQRGKLVGTVPREGATEQSLARLMVGREVVLEVDKEPASPGETLLEVEALTVEDDRASRRCAARASTCAPARSWVSPGSTGTDRPSSSKH